MNYASLSPEEKLLCAVFGRTMHDAPWLSESGKQQVDTVLEELPSKRELLVIRLRFGFEPRTEAEKSSRYYSSSRTLAEVGVRLGVTGERIRQIEQKALRKLRHPSRIKYLRPLLEGRG